MKATPSLIAVAFALAAAATAQAEPAPDIMTAHRAQPAVTALQTKLGGPTLDLSSPHAAFNVAYDRAGPARIPGVAKTSIDRRLSSDELMGSLGFLCGLEPGSGKQGAAAMRGYDPTGRFVGAKLRLAFR